MSDNLVTEQSPKTKVRSPDIKKINLRVWTLIKSPNPQIKFFFKYQVKV